MNASEIASRASYRASRPGVLSAGPAGLEPLEPGLVPVSDWRPLPGEPRPDRPVPVYALLAQTSPPPA